MGLFLWKWFVFSGIPPPSPLSYGIVLTHSEGDLLILKRLIRSIRRVGLVM